ncbi:helix-turn-helix domain-containing protein [Corynebacterium callunae]|uniref:helix-turn-helix domain-containing protein n=1 Tax=Corynebacterium callunae TaxID=1721 RepID=UPI0039827305
MSQLVEILESLWSGKAMPEDLQEHLSPQELDVVRAVENSINAEKHWRDIALSIMGTAKNLSRGEDRSKVLDELVESSRRIIRSDVAYISINDLDAQITRVLTTSGVITEQFRAVEIPLGIGVIGNVAQTRQVSWTYDQGTDPELSRTPHVDEVVRGEGVRGIMGAPLVNNGEIIGTLMVGDRRPRRYTAEEKIILDSLASMASVAMETSQLIADLEENVAALKVANERSQLQVAQLRALSEADSQLMEVLSRGTQLKAIREVVHKALDCEVWFYREGAFLLEKDKSTHTPPAEDLIKSLMLSSEQRGEIVNEEGFSVLSISFNQRQLGAICVNRTVRGHQAAILNRAAQAFATIVLFREAVVEAESRQVDDLLRRFIAGTAVEEDLLRIKRMTGLNLARNNNVCVAVLVSPTSLPQVRATKQHLAENDVVFEFENRLCILFEAPAGIEKSLDKLLEWLKAENYKVYMGAIKVPDDLSAVAKAHNRAITLATSMQSLHLDNQVATPTTFGSLGLLLGLESVALNDIITDTVGALLDFDQRNNAELATTAAVYFDNARNIAATAKTLFVHSNTVRQRIDKISSIIGEDWATGPRSFDIHLALRAWQITKK